MMYPQRPAAIDPHNATRHTTEAVPDIAGYDVTARQLECLAWAGDGKSASEIGMILGISARTVEGHLAKICDTLGVRKRVQAVVKARDLGMLPVLRR